VTSREEEARQARKVVARAIRRLDILEWVGFAAAAGLAIGGGWAVAWLLQAPTGLAFRPTWVVASLVLFVVPGGISLMLMRREERKRLEEIRQRLEDEDG
jgi:uncharacterized membrane protein